MADGTLAAWQKPLFRRHDEKSHKTPSVIPAKAGIHLACCLYYGMDPRLRGDDSVADGTLAARQKPLFRRHDEKSHKTPSVIPAKAGIHRR